MKIRNGFVSNSSSSSFIIRLRNKIEDTPDAKLKAIFRKSLTKKRIDNMTIVTHDDGSGKWLNAPRKLSYDEFIQIVRKNVKELDDTYMKERIARAKEYLLDHINRDMTCEHDAYVYNNWMNILDTWESGWEIYKIDFGNSEAIVIYTGSYTLKISKETILDCDEYIEDSLNVKSGGDIRWKLSNH